MKKVLIIDGMAVIRRMAEAIFTSESEDLVGKIINASYHTFHNICMDHKADLNYIVLEGDTKEHPSWRLSLLPSYKAARPEAPPEVGEAIPLISLRVAKFATVTSQEGKEADDVWATLATKHCLDGDIVVLATGDKDALGLLDMYPGKLKVWHPFKNATLTASYVQKRYGVSPSQFWQWQAFVGDPVDGIPGVRGVGPKTATTLLSEYGSIDGVYANLDKLTPTIAKKLTEGKAMLEISLKLATLETTKKQERLPEPAQLGLF